MCQSVVTGISLCFIVLVSGSFPGSILAQNKRGPALHVAVHVDFLDATAREPMIVEHPNGTLFVSGYSGSGIAEGGSWGPPQTVPRLWKSSDHGATWSAVNVGSEEHGAIGNCDVDLAIAPDGTIYLVSMGYDEQAMEGTHIAVGASADIGKTWHWTMLSRKRFDDRPWVAVAPDGTAHVVWNDGAGVYHSMSKDKGASWSAAQTIHPAGGSSHLAVGPKGELAVRVIPISASFNHFDKDVDLIMVSIDGGTTWKERSVPGQRRWALTIGATPRWVEPVAWDGEGSLYLLWSEVSGVWLARSRDRGIRWRKWRIADNEDDTLPYYPYLTALGSGELAATWFSGAGESLRWQVCEIEIESPNFRPQVTKSDKLMVDAWRAGFPPISGTVQSTAGEYIPVLFLSEGPLVAVTPIQNKAANHFGFSFWRFSPSPPSQREHTK